MTDFYTTLDTLHDVLQDEIDDKQDQLTAGANITIDENNVISASGGKIPYVVCSTSHATAAKKITIPDYTLAAGDVIVVKFSNTNTATNPTLSVNNGEAYPLLFFGSTVVGTYPWRAGTVETLTFDGSNFYLNGHSGASTSYLGLVKLSSSIVSTSETYAATPKAVSTLNTNKQEKLTAGENITIDETNTISATGQVFVATYGTTTYADVAAAVNAGKVVICKSTNRYAALTQLTSSKAVFFDKDDGDTFTTRTLNSSDVWSLTTYDYQSKLTPGANITIDMGIISATDTTYSAGSNITISEENEISATVPQVSATSNYADGTTVGTVSIDGNTTTYKTPYWVGTTDGGITVGTSGYRREVAADFTKVQAKMTAGSNITIDESNNISATDTTYTAGNGIDLSGGAFSLGFPHARYDSTTGNILDLNTVSVEGFHRYYINTEYVQNFPEDAFYSTGDFYADLLVVKSYSVNRNAQVLYLVDARGGKLYYRTKATTSVWGRWQRIDSEPLPENDTKTVVTPVGSTVYFRAIESVQDPNNTLTYKWQVSSTYGRTWQDSTGSGYNTNTLTVSATAGRNNQMYRCVISGATQSITTTPSKLVVLS